MAGFAYANLLDFHATLFPHSMDHKASTTSFYVPAEHFSPEKTLSSRTANDTDPSLSLFTSVMKHWYGKRVAVTATAHEPLNKTLVSSVDV